MTTSDKFLWCKNIKCKTIVYKVGTGQNPPDRILPYNPPPPPSVLT